MRRVLPLLVTAAITLAACSDDDTDSVTELSLVEIEATEPSIDDVCATEAPASTDATGAGGTAAGDTAGGDTAGGDTVPAATATSDTDSGDTVTDSTGTTGETDTGDTATAGSDGPESAVPGSTDPADSSPDASATDGSESDGSDPDGTGTDDSETPESTGPVATSEPPDTGPYATAPEVEPEDSAPEELVRTVIEEGEGPEAGVGDVVRVYYSGELSADGQVFDSNYGTDTPLDVVLAGEGEQPMVIEGWNEGLIGARKGDRIQLDIPSELAYGEQGNTSIPPNADLTFIVDVVDVISPVLPEETPTELEKTVLVEGPEDGAVAGDGTILYVNYLGVFSDTGAVFDSNFGPGGTPFKVELAPTASGVIEGWNEGLHGVRVGDRIQLDVPSDLAYGEEGNGTIPPDTALTFVIEVIDLIPMVYPDSEPEELEKTMIEEGDPDGTAAQFFDTVTFNMVIGVPEFAVEEPSSSSVPESSTPGDSAPTGSTEPGESTEPGGSTTPADSTEPTGSTTPAESTSPADSTEPDGTETAASTDVDGSQPDGSDTEGTETAGSETPSSEPDESESAPGYSIVNTYDAPPPDQATGQQTPAQPVVAQLVRGGLGVPYPGLEDGLEGARPGDKFRLTVPGDQGLGEAGANFGLPADATTVVYVEVLDVAAQPTIEVPEVAPTELTVTTLEEGTGIEAADGDTVLVRYIGVVTDTNRRVDSNWEGAPDPLVLGDETYITGFEDGLVGAQAGERLQIDIPADEAYGADSVPLASIPSDAALSFLVDVVAVIPATSADDAPTDVELPLSSTPITPPPVTVDAATLESNPDATAAEALPEIVITDIVDGEGDPLTTGQTAIVNVYAVCASNGAVLQNTWEDDQRQFIAVSSSSIIEGFAEGLAGGAELEGMRVGGLRTIQVPAALAYADRGSEELGIGSDRDLIFVVELYGFA